MFMGFIDVYKLLFLFTNTNLILAICYGVLIKLLDLICQINSKDSWPKMLFAFKMDLNSMSIRNLFYQ